MIKKPDVLSDEQLSEIEYFAIESPDKDAPESFKKRERRRHIAQAQLNVCAEYYEPLIKEMYEALEEALPLLHDEWDGVNDGAGNRVISKIDKALAKVDKKKGL